MSMPNTEQERKPGSEAGARSGPLPAFVLRTARAEIAVRQFVSDLSGKTEYALYIDGDWQFSTDKERIYHESLCVPPWALAAREPPQRALILGGGDGLAARTLNRLTGGQALAVTLVDYDAEFVRLCAANPVLSRINEGSLSAPNLRYECADAFEWVSSRTMTLGGPGEFDLVVVDYPSLSPMEPSSEKNLSRLFSAKHFADILALVAPGGAMCAQFSCPAWIGKGIMEEFISAGSHRGSISLFRFSPHYTAWRDSMEEFLLVAKHPDPFVRRSPEDRASFMDVRRLASLMKCRRVTSVHLEHEELFGGPWMAP